MRRLFGPVVGLTCVGVLVLACFGSALLADAQFAYRDASHYYYPLYERVQQEWDAGRLPLWEPEENGGMPLLGNPTAAVLYPGKLIYAALPYPWAARVYIIAHVLLAVAAMYALMRHWAVSRAGSAIAALSYAFSAPVLFQYCNVIFLVGAAWTPLGFRAADRWLRQGRRSGIVELCLVLAMQTLGGDPQSSYVTGLFAAGYAFGLAWARPSDLPLRRRWWGSILGLVLLATWVGLTIGAATIYPRLDLSSRPFTPWIAALHEFSPGIIGGDPRKPPVGPSLDDLLRYKSWRIVPLAFWSSVALAILLRRRREPRSDLRRMLAGLVVAAVVAGALMGLQLVPTLEFARLTVRAAEQGTHEIFPFSLEPIRLVELAWPEVFGSTMSNRQWLMLVPPAHTVKFWVPSLYLGGLTLLLAVGALGVRGGPPWRAWLAVVSVASLLLSLGQFASPLTYARMVPEFQETIGPHDPEDYGELRRDGYLADGVVSPYWVMASTLPGFRSFRYPSKFLTFACLGLAGLAGIGWDRAVAGRRRWGFGVGVALATLGLLACIGTVLGSEVIVAYWRGQIESGLPAGNTFGPFDPHGALMETRLALLFGSLVLGLSASLLIMAPRRPRSVAVLALVLLTADLTLANARLVRTVPQSLMEGTPFAFEVIEQAEAEAQASGDARAGGPYRVHRMPLWEPSAFRQTTSDDRVRELVAWERRTIQPKFAIPFGTEYTITLGVSELYDYWFFFAPFMSNHDDAIGAQFGLKPGQRLVYYPRRGFDLWNTRYFVLPRVPSNTEGRGYVAFLGETERIYPPESGLDALSTAEAIQRWDAEEDWQILRNKNAFPRAWVVHQIRRVDPIVGLNRADRESVMEELVYQGDDLWYVPGRTVYDPRRLAWIETDNATEILPFPSGVEPDLSETVRVTRYEPTRVEIEAELTSPGIVVLADVNYPGWKLTLDGSPAPILRANRLMRGAAVPSGRHSLVYTFEPRSVQIGGVLSGAGLIALALLGVWSWRQRG